MRRIFNKGYGYCIGNGFDSHAGQLHLKYLNSKFRFKSIVIDVSGLGLPIAERLKEEGDFRKIVKFKSTLAEQFEVYDHLKTLMENKRLTLPLAQDRLLMQLKLLTFEVLPSQKAPRIRGTEGKATDDFADALMFYLAMVSARNSFLEETRSKYQRQKVVECV